MQVTRDFPICSIPYIDLTIQPERFEENERNKKDYGWQEGDGWFVKDIPSYYEKSFGMQRKQLLDKFESYFFCVDLTSKTEEIQSYINNFGPESLNVEFPPYGRTALMMAVNLNEISKVKIFLHLNVNPSMGNKRGYTPLWRAIEKKREYDVFIKRINNGEKLKRKDVIEKTVAYDDWVFKEKMELGDYKNCVKKKPSYRVDAYEAEIKLEDLQEDNMANDVIIMLLWIHHAFISPKLTEGCLFQFNSLKQRFFKEIIKELYVGLADPGSSISMLPKDIVHSIALTGINLFLHPNLSKEQPVQSEK